ncbi:MAG: phosphohydrolase [Chloroflexi bacterium]|nr:phosphohydrolase [Chloroflexota bacterium]
MDAGCPGKDFRNLRAFLLKCPKCNAEVEMFTDEMKIKCPKCGEKIYRDKTPSCVEWCSSARKCLGEKRWRELTNQKEEEQT